MMFCPKCESLLLPKDGKMRCKCGYSGEDSKIKDKKKKVDDIVVMDHNIETLPKIKADCDKCGNKDAYFWTKQTRGGDEPETRFFRCAKCGHTWREY